VNVLPPIVIVPVRLPGPSFLVTLNFTVPLPVPLSPSVIVIQEAFVVAVHVQPVPAVTLMVVPFCAFLFRF
jgi:hypothetical protein